RCFSGRNPPRRRGVCPNPGGRGTGSEDKRRRLRYTEPAMPDQLRHLERLLYRQMRRTAEDHALLAPDDRVMVAISGGKDSYSLLALLGRLVARLPFKVELIAVHLDQQQPGYDGKPLETWLQASGFAHEILSEDTYSVVVDKVKEGATYCSLCSR